MAKAQDTKNGNGYKPETIKPRNARRYIEEILEAPKIAVVEKPEGKIVIFHIINGEEQSQKVAEVVSKPRRGLTKDQIDMACSMFHKHPCFRALFDSVPLKEYYLHVVFYGEGFSEEVKYLSPNFSILFIEVPDIEHDTFMIGSFDTYEKFLDDTGLNIKGFYNGAVPMFYQGPPSTSQIAKVKNLSELSVDGEGVGVYIICYPIYNQFNGKLAVFES